MKVPSEIKEQVLIHSPAIPWGKSGMYFTVGIPRWRFIKALLKGEGMYRANEQPFEPKPEVKVTSQCNCSTVNKKRPFKALSQEEKRTYWREAKRLQRAAQKRAVN